MRFIVAIPLMLLGFAPQPSRLLAGVPEAEPPASERFAEPTEEVPVFQRHVAPLLGRLGCNGRSCHGSFQGRGGFRLSLFGYDFQMDHASLVARGSDNQTKRVLTSNPRESLILQKPTMRVEHEGGRRFESGSWQENLLRQWIEAGAEGVAHPETLTDLIVEPTETVFTRAGETAQLTVTAIWKDGSREDVTPLCRFRSNDDSIVDVDEDGKLTAKGVGDTHVIAFYDNGVCSIPVLQSFQPPSSYQPTESPHHPVDAFIVDKLNKLKIVPSSDATDAEFLRRVSIDLTGTLPTPKEIQAFLNASDVDKRGRKIDELLERPEYAAWWTNKLCDFTGCNPRQQAELGQEISVQWYSWIYARIRENTPYNEIVRRIVLATSRDGEQSYADFAEQTSAYFRDSDKHRFENRETMPHYWSRRSMQKPEQAAEAFAHNFLGIRLQCAQCHKHPFAPWTQDDYKEFSRFFEPVKFGAPVDAKNEYESMARRFGINLRGNAGGQIRPEALRRARQGETLPWRELYIEHRNDSQSLSLLRSGTVNIDGDEDPRREVMDWMEREDNDWFARAFVNRVWATYFHRGLIDPPDDLNPANPPSHPLLLHWLSTQFIQSGYDMKWLHRTIVSSQTYQRSWRPSANNHSDQHNFSRMVPRRMPAEVVYDAVKQAIAESAKSSEVRTDLSRRATGHLSMRLAGTYAMQVFGKPDRVVNCDCERDNQPTLLQSIFLQNDPLIEQRIDASGWLQQLSEQQKDQQDLDALVKEAWLRTLSRQPQQAEIDRAKRHIDQAASVVDGMRDLLWALINTKEFILIR